MSVYAYMVGTKTKQVIWLGKSVHHNHQPFYFHIGEATQPKNWENETLNKVVWKFLAQNAGGSILVLMEHEMTEAYYAYRQIGGDRDVDISFEAYLEDWKGIW